MLWRGQVVLETVEPLTLTEKRAIHLRALRTFTDEFGVQRRAGEEWLLTIDDCETHIPDVNEEVVNPMLPLIVLSRCAPPSCCLSLCSLRGECVDARHEPGELRLADMGRAVGDARD